MRVHDLTGTLLILGVWIFCSVGGGLLSSFVDGEYRPRRNVLGLLALGYPIVVTQSLRGWMVAPLLGIGAAVVVAVWRWCRPRLNNDPRC